jgi:hypothetical protein
MPEEHRHAVAELLQGQREVLEAHLPQMQVEGLIDMPRQALVIVLKDMSRGAPLAQQLASKLTSVFPDGEVPPIVPVDRRSDLVQAVRAAGCCVKERRPSWKLWG